MALFYRAGSNAARWHAVFPPGWAPETPALKVRQPGKQHALGQMPNSEGS